MSDNDESALMPANAVCQLLGGISDMTLWRLVKKQDGFPCPVYVGRRRFWRRSAVNAWIDAQAERGPPAKVA